MKNIKYWLIAICAICSTSCDDFLTEEPKSLIMKETVFSSLTNAESAVIGLYSEQAILWGNYYFVIANYSNDEACCTWTNDLALFSNINGNQTSSTTSVYNMWLAAYKNIVDANACIERIPNIVTEEAEEPIQKQLIAEAKFLRAFTYFDLIQLFGSVPLYLKDSNELTEDQIVGRTDEGEIMDQIILDAEAAYEDLPDRAMNGRASKWAAAMLLAKVYMLQGGYFKDSVTNQDDENFANGDTAKQIAAYEKAIVYLSDIEENSGHSLLELDSADDFKGYGSLFLRSKREAVSSEVIFDLQYNGSTRVSNWGTRSINGGAMEYPSEGYFYNWAGGLAASEFALSYHDDDVRFKWNIGTYSLKDGLSTRKSEPIAYWTHSKYRMESYNLDQGVAIYRYADVLLMLAECINAIEGQPDQPYTIIDGVNQPVVTRTAYEYINEVRARAYQEPLDKTYIETLYPGRYDPLDDYGWICRNNFGNQGTEYTQRHVYYASIYPSYDETKLFQEALKMERAWELCFERHRWFDLKRWGTLIESASKSQEIYGAMNDVSDPLDKKTVNTTGLRVENRRISNLTEQYLYMPIPTTEMMVNPKLKPQNFGY